MIAFHFHPDLEVGAIRTIKFAKYLREFGWEPHVLSVEPQFYEKTDATPLPFDCQVTRTSKWPVLGDYYLWAKRLIIRMRPQREDSNAGQFKSVPEMNYSVPHVAPYWRRFINSLSWTPDNHVGWLFPSIWKAIRVARKIDADVIYSSGPPQTGHLIGGITSLVTGKPFVSDFRDPWSTAEKSREITTPLSLKIEKKMEGFVVRRSRLVLTTTDEFRDVLVQLYQPGLNGRCKSLVNGYDHEDFSFPETDLRKPDRTIRFLYAGTLYMGRDPRGAIVALGEMVKLGKLSKSDFVFDFYGSVDIDPAPLQEIIDSYGINANVRFNASVKRADYLKLLRDADVLVLIQSDMTPAQIPAKTFEYLATGNEILALAPPGATANILRGFEHAHVVSPSDQEQVASCVDKIIRRIRSGASEPVRNRSSLQRLHKRQLTRQLAEMLDQVVAENKF